MKQLSGHDMVMLLQETAAAPNHMGPLLICDQSTAPGGRVTFKEILAGIEARLHLAPILRRRLVRVPMGLDAAYWVEDEDFDLEFHVRHIALPKPGDWRQLCIQFARLQSRPLDMSRPPWELYVVEGVDNVDGVPPGSFAIVMKIHHASIDGKEGAQLMTVLTGIDPKAEVPPPKKKWKGEHVPSAVSLIARSALRTPSIPLTAANLLREAVPAVPGAIARLRGGRTVPTTRFNGPVTPHRVFDAVLLDLDEVRRVRKATAGATVNDVGLCLVGGALRRYLESKGEPTDPSLVAIVPVSTRLESQDGTGGNRIENTKVPLRTDVADDRERLGAIAATTHDIRTVQKGISIRHMAQMSELVPGALLGLGIRAGVDMMARTGVAAIANTLVTNVPGPPMPLWFLGTKVVRGLGTAPLTAGMGLVHLISSYTGQLTVSIGACREMLPDPAFYADCVRDSFAELGKTA